MLPKHCSNSPSRALMPLLLPRLETVTSKLNVLKWLTEGVGNITPNTAVLHDPHGHLTVFCIRTPVLNADVFTVYRANVKTWGLAES